jgi:hypothetical protein
MVSGSTAEGAGDAQVEVTGAFYLRWQLGKW